LEHSETIINGTGPALLAAVIEHVRPLPLRDRSAQKAQHESARTHTHTLALSLSLLFSSSLFSWFRFQFGAWSCDRPPSSSGSGSSLVRGLVIVLPLCYGPVPVCSGYVISFSLYFLFRFHLVRFDVFGGFSSRVSYASCSLVPLWTTLDHFGPLFVAELTWVHIFGYTRWAP
jgi:hypothetical protein